MLERVQHQEQAARSFYLGKVSCLHDVLLVLKHLSASFCLFLAVDAISLNDEETRSTAKLLVERGIAYFCVWGPDCERVHDLFDLERLADEPLDRVVMTTWHSKVSLSEGLWFFKHCAEPVEGFAADCRDWVVLSMANEPWAQQIRSAFMERR